MRSKTIYLIVFLLLKSSFLAAQWNPDAGLVDPYPIANVSISSGAGSQYVIDGNINTAWRSDMTFPFNYIKQADKNILLGLGATNQFSSSNQIDGTKATDGNINSGINIKPTNAIQWLNWLAFDFTESTPLYAISIKAKTPSAIQVYIFKENGDSIKIGTVLAKTNYRLNRLKFPVDNITGIKLYSTSSFTIYEIAAIKELPSEYAIVDLGSQKTIGAILTKHWSVSNSTLSTTLYASNDKVEWTEVKQLDPNEKETVSTIVSPPITARYIKVSHQIGDVDWKRVSIWEIKVYDEFGLAGPLPQAKQATATINELFGINGFWSWDNFVHSNTLGFDEGPYLYSKIANHARSYHNMAWDTNDPDHTPDYERMSNGHGTYAQSWLNWDDEYSAWKDAGLSIQASIQFNNHRQPIYKWDNPYQAAYNYGYAFAKHFGPTYGQDFVQSVEVGNEPWNYPASFYKKVLKGMAEGVKAADPAMEVYPAAFQANNPSLDGTTGGNYMGTRITETEAPLLDALNAHCYSYLNKEDGERISVHPEHPQSEFRNILNVIRFRDNNMPATPIHLTEWGWDSDGVGEDCTHSECVSEQAQASYLVRGALFMNRLGIDKLHWFFFANGEESSSIYTRSGLTGSRATNFAPKKSFLALQGLKHHIGECHFMKVIQEDDEAWVYLYGNEEDEPTHIVAWRPVDGNNTTKTMVTVPLPNQYLIGETAWELDGLKDTGTQVVLAPCQDGSVHVDISAIPTIVKLKDITVREAHSLTDGGTTLQWDLAYDNLGKELTIDYTLPFKSQVNIAIYNLHGQFIQQLGSTNNLPLAAGKHQIAWSTKHLQAGMYIFKVMVTPVIEGNIATGIQPIVATEKLLIRQ